MAWRDVNTSPSYTKFTNDEWSREYTSDLVQYGDLFLAYNETAQDDFNETTGDYTAIPLPVDLNVTVLRNLTGNIPNNPLRTPLRSSPEDKWLRFADVMSGDYNRTKFGNASMAHIIDSRAEIVPTRSRIELSLRFMIIVIFCNAIKLGMMVWVLFREKRNFIVTLGDGAASFLESPDPTTEGLCTLSKDTIVTMVGPHSVKSVKGDALGEVMSDAYSVWNKRYHTYSSALDRDRELGSSFM